MFRALIRYNDPDLVTKLVAELHPMFRTWILQEADRVGRMPLLDPHDKARLFTEIQKKLAQPGTSGIRGPMGRMAPVHSRVDPRTSDLAKRLVILLILTEANKDRGQDQPGHTTNPDLTREIKVEQTAIHNIARVQEKLYDAALEMLENIRA